MPGEKGTDDPPGERAGRPKGGRGSGGGPGRGRRRRTLPPDCSGSTIRAVGLNGRVRDGNEWFPHAIATDHLPVCPGSLQWSGSPCIYSSRVKGPDPRLLPGDEMRRAVEKRAAPGRAPPGGAEPTHRGRCGPRWLFPEGHDACPERLGHLTETGRCFLDGSSVGAQRLIGDVRLLEAGGRLVKPLGGLVRLGFTCHHASTYRLST